MLSDAPTAVLGPVVDDWPTRPLWRIDLTPPVWPTIDLDTVTAGARAALYQPITPRLSLYEEILAGLRRL